MQFKEKVYKIVKNIKKGDILSYKQVASLVGNPKAFRAVGNILNKNRDKNVPCHRVIKSNKEIGGYYLGINKKVLILKKEGVKIKKLPSGSFLVD